MIGLGLGLGLVSRGGAAVPAFTMNAGNFPGTYADWDAGTALNLGSLDSGGAWTKVGTGNITEATPP